MYIVTYLRRFEDTKSTLIAKVDFVRLRSTNTVAVPGLARIEEGLLVAHHLSSPT